MKKNIQFILLMFALLLPATAMAYDFEVDGIYYLINGNEVTVTYQQEVDVLTWFSDYSGSVNIPAAVTYNDTTYSVTAIGNYAFWYCSGLTSVTIPNSVTSVDAWAFEGCSCLTSVVIPNSVVSIGLGAFSGCSSLTSIDIPNSVTSIGDLAFSGCSSLTSIDIPNSVTSIGDLAFSGCNGLTSVVIPNSVTHIDRNAFTNCSSLISIMVASCNPNYDSRNNCNAIIETATNTLISGCMNTLIPSSVTSIGDRAFSGCSGITSIAIPNSVTSIGGGAFSWCGLDSIIIPNSVTSIGDNGFAFCSNLTSVTMGNSVTSIGDYAFNDCRSLTEIYSLALIPPTVYVNTFKRFYGVSLYVLDIALGSYKEADYWKDFTNIVGKPYTFKVDGTNYHATTMNTASVMAKNDEGTFYSGDVEIPDSVTYERLTFAVTGIENNAFDGCFELTSVVIGDNVESIGTEAFQGCTGLTSVTIGSGVTSIGAKAFNYCNALQTVTCLGKVPPVMASSDCFSSAAYSRATLLVPRQFIEDYQATNYWYRFAHIDGWGSVGMGDVDGDGNVSIKDVTVLIDTLLGVESDSFYFESADLNNNGHLDIGDVTSLIDNLLNN